MQSRLTEREREMVETAARLYPVDLDRAPAPRPLSPIQSQILTLWNGGLEVKDISKATGRSKGTVYHYLATARSKGHKVESRRLSKIDGEMRLSVMHLEVVRLWNSGLQGIKIAKRLKISQEYVWRIARLARERGYYVAPRMKNSTGYK